MKHILPLTILVLCLCMLPAAAVIQEVTIKGTVSAVSLENNTFTITDPARYGCSYPASGDVVCSFTPMDRTSLSGSVPSDSAYTVFNIGDSVVATSLGGEGVTWITLAKLLGPADPQAYVTDIVGDPSTIPTSLAGDYSIWMSNTPDCMTCSGTTCKAALSKVEILSGTDVVMSKDLKPGYSMTYNGRNDGSSVTATFVKGQAPSNTCAAYVSGMAGPQTVSVYVVNVVPPVGFTDKAAVTPPPEVTMPAEARPTATKSGMLPFVALVALALIAIFGFSRRE
ncbi:MAG: hypothetical protein M0Q92_04915 [Methanoregula sp.]|jgi:hypothetical protein|nr:hypothetical protein [Methanoregula sp.]